jgi:hypothetical protein
MHNLSSKKQIIIISIAFIGFVIFCIGVRFGYVIVSENLRENTISDSKISSQKVKN